MLDPKIMSHLDSLVSKHPRVAGVRVIKLSDGGPIRVVVTLDRGGWAIMSHFGDESSEDWREFFCDHIDTEVEAALKDQDSSNRGAAGFR